LKTPKEGADTEWTWVPQGLGALKGKRPTKTIPSTFKGKKEKLWRWVAGTGWVAGVMWNNKKKIYNLQGHWRPRKFRHENFRIKG